MADPNTPNKPAKGSGANPPESSPALARKSAMNLLARRDHSAVELRRKLVTRGYVPADVDAAVAQLAAEGLLSEKRFVESFVASRVRRGKGPVAIRGELDKRGVSAADIEAGFAGAEVDWAAAARAARRKRFGTNAPVDLRESARQMRFLQQRGFTAEDARRAVQAAGHDSDTDAADQPE